MEKVPSTQSRELILSLELDLSAHSLLAVTCTSYVSFFSVLKTIFPWIVFLAFFFVFVFFLFLTLQDEWTYILILSLKVGAVANFEQGP